MNRLNDDDLSLTRINPDAMRLDQGVVYAF